MLLININENSNLSDDSLEDSDKDPGSENVNLILFHVRRISDSIPHLRKPI